MSLLAAVGGGKLNGSVSSTLLLPYLPCMIDTRLDTIWMTIFILNGYLTDTENRNFIRFIAKKTSKFTQETIVLEKSLL